MKIVHCGQGEFFRCARPNFLLQKNLRFFENYDMSAPISQKGLRQQRENFADKEEGSIFYIFLRMSFMDGSKKIFYKWLVTGAARPLPIVGSAV